jgi:hypothetical protein
MSQLRGLEKLVELVGVWADTGISSMGRVADENAPVGRVILDWTDERMDVRRSLWSECMGKHGSQDRRCLMMMPRLWSSHPGLDVDKRMGVYDDR